MAPLKIFICYKKILTQEKDGKTILYKDASAQILNFILSHADGVYDPWFDKEDIVTGMDWEAAIYRRILDSDVMLLLSVGNLSVRMGKA